MRKLYGLVRFAAVIILSFIMLVPASLFSQNESKKQKHFIKVAEIEAPENFNICPAQFSKDGTKLYVPMMHSVDSTGQIQVYSVDAGGKVKLIKTLKLSKYENMAFNGQVSLSADELTMTFTACKDNSWLNNELFEAQRKTTEAEFNNPRYLGELNDTAAADAYSWISADGLHLYYIHGGAVMYTYRARLRDAFGYPRELSLGENSDNWISLWLTQDELIMFFSDGQKLYKASRPEFGKPFSEPKVWTNEFEDSAFISGISFTPSMKLMAAYIAPNSGSTICIYKVIKMK